MSLPHGEESERPRDERGSRGGVEIWRVPLKNVHDSGE